MKTYFAKFGSGDPLTWSGLSPTLTVFSANGLTAIAAPGITETPVGSGFYRFLWQPTLPIVFKMDGFTTGLAPSDRYVSGVLDPVNAVDEQMTAQGITLVDLMTNVGTTASSLGFTAADPSTLFGLMKRVQENLEGTGSYAKSTGIWSIQTRGGTLLATRTLANTSTTSTKT